MFPNVASLFRAAPQQQQPASQQQQQTAQPPQPTGQPGSSLGQSPTPPGQQQKADSPLDAFKALWQDTPESRTQQTDPFSTPLFNMDPTKVNEAIGQINFVGQLDPALVQKAMSGQDPQAFMDVINEVGRKALHTSVQLSTATAEQAGQKLGQRFNTAMPARFRDLQTKSQAPTNPLLSNPAVAPMLDAVRQRLLTQNPDWTPAQVQAKAEEYLSTFASELQNSDPNKAAERKTAAAANQAFDWDTWASGNPEPTT